MTPMVINPFGFGGGGGGGLDLSDLPGYRIAYLSHLDTYSDTSLTTPVSTNGSAAQGWKNQNGAISVHATKRPGTADVTVDTTNTLNGYRTLRFPGGAALDISTPLTGSESGGTVYLVVKKDPPAGNVKGLYHMGGGGDGIWYPEGTNIKDNTLSNDRPDVGTPVLTLEAWRVWCVRNSASGKKIWLNNSVQYTGVVSFVAFNTTGYLGISGNGGSLTGNVAAMFIFGASHSDSDQATAWSRISAFYAL